MFSKIKKIFSSKITLVFLSLVVSLGIITGAFLYKTNRVGAYCTTSQGTLCFGGPIRSVYVCCNGLKITVGGPREGTFLFTAGSKLYMWYNLTAGQCVLGDAWHGGVCLKPTSWPPCTDVERVDGIIRYVGTTLSGPAAGTCTGG